MYHFRNKGLFVYNKDSQLPVDLFRQYSNPLDDYSAKFIEDKTVIEIDQDLFSKHCSDQTITVSLSLNSLLFPMARNNCLKLPEKQKIRNNHFHFVEAESFETTGTNPILYQKPKEGGKPALWKINPSKITEDGLSSPLQNHFLTN